jgi:hypothetical protein
MYKIQWVLAVAAALFLSAFGASAQVTPQPANQIYATPCSGPGYLGFRALCPADLGNSFSNPVPFGNITPNTGAFSTLSSATSSNFADMPRSLQSFGAIGDGVADDTAATQTALNSGAPLTCKGKFRLTSLVTITNTNLNVKGGGNESCVLVLDNSQTMIYATLTAGVSPEYTTNTFVMKDVKISVNAAITSVTGPAHTAALYITYPNGTNGIVQQTVILENVRIKPTAAANYVINGVYINDATNVRLINFQAQGRKSLFDSTSNAIVYDGTHSPTGLIVMNSYAHVYGTGLYAPYVASTGWQGIRVKNFDCVYCGYPVYLLGAGDGLTDYADISGVEGGQQNGGIYVANVTHVWIRDNYIFLADMPIPGGSHAAYPFCFQAFWSLTPPINGAANQITSNTCDGNAVTGYTGRYGVIIGGASAAGMASHVGLNMLTNLDVGFQILAGTKGLFVDPQQTKGVTTYSQNLATPFDNVVLGVPSNGLFTIDANETKTGTESMTSALGGALLTVGARTAGDTNPTRITVDDSYSTVAGANPKIMLRSNGNGIGESASSQDYDVATGSVHNFFVNAVPMFTVSASSVAAAIPLILKTYTIAGLAAVTCNAGLKGAMVFVSDTTFLAASTRHGAVTGGGAVTDNTAVSCTGAAWQEE